MKYRIAMWASAGFLVAAWWALYFASRNKDNPITYCIHTRQADSADCASCAAFCRFFVLGSGCKYCYVCVARSDGRDTAAAIKSLKIVHDRPCGSAIALAGSATS
jgi:hypothetical protein